MGGRLLLLQKLITILIISYIQICSNVTSNPNTQLLTILCNSGEYSKGDPFGMSLAYVLEELESTTPTTKNLEYYNISPYPNAFAYGHAACARNITSSDCKTCLVAAKTAVVSSCPSRIGARSVLHDCTQEYEFFYVQKDHILFSGMVKKKRSEASIS